METLYGIVYGYHGPMACEKQKSIALDRYRHPALFNKNRRKKNFYIELTLFDDLKNVREEYNRLSQLTNQFLSRESILRVENRIKNDKNVCACSLPSTNRNAYIYMVNN